jgi:hypothetical protein
LEFWAFELCWAARSSSLIFVSAHYLCFLWPSAHRFFAHGSSQRCKRTS